MVIQDSLVVVQSMRGEWKCVTPGLQGVLLYGVLYAIDSGQRQSHKLFAIILAIVMKKVAI